MVKLISITPDAEKTMGFIARVSNPKNQENPEVSGLLKYCIKHGHWSVFEQAHMTLEIETTRGLGAQILRHRSFTFQEFSQRYSDATGFEDTSLRKQADKNRQSSEEEINPTLLADYKNITALVAVRDHFHKGKKLYDELIEEGVARECARMVLPLGTQTTMYMNGTVRSWIHYINLRTEENTQKEHRDIANAIKNIFIDNFPNVSEALGWKLHEWTKEELEEMGWEDFRSFHRKSDESAHE